MEKFTHKRLLLILLVISYFLLMFGNGIVSLTHPDEVFYIQTAKEMVQHNSWLTPMIFDEPQFEKPILALFLFALSVKFFGLAPFAARFWPAFFGIIGVGTVYWIYWTIFRRKTGAFLSGLILSSCFIYMALSRAVLTDMIFSVFIALSMAFFAWAYFDRKKINLKLVLSFVFIGLAVLTKGLLGFTFPVTAIVLYLLYRKDLKFLLRKGTFLGLLVFGVIAVPWHVLMYMEHGQWFIEEYFYNVHVRRLQVAEHPRLDNWYFYIALMFAGVFPWSLFWFPAIKRIFLQFKKKLADRQKTAFLLFWILSVYIYTQPAHSKLASYIFPAFFAIVILLANYIDAVVLQARGEKRIMALKVCSYVFIGALIIAVIGGIIVSRIFIDVIVNPTSIYLYCGILAITGGLIFLFYKNKQYVKMVFSYSGVSAGLLVMLLFAKPYAEPWVSCIGISKVFNDIDKSDTTVLASKFYVRGVRFFTDRKMAVMDVNGKGFFSPHPIPFFDYDYKVYDFLETQPFTYAIVKEGDRLDLGRITRDKPYSMEQLGYMGGKYIIKLQRNDL